MIQAWLQHERVPPSPPPRPYIFHRIAPQFHTSIARKMRRNLQANGRAPSGDMLYMINAATIHKKRRNFRQYPNKRLKRQVSKTRLYGGSVIHQTAISRKDRRSGQFTLSRSHHLSQQILLQASQRHGRQPASRTIMGGGSSRKEPSAFVDANSNASGACNSLDAHPTVLLFV